MMMIGTQKMGGRNRTGQKRRDVLTMAAVGTNSRIAMDPSTRASTRGCPYYRRLRYSSVLVLVGITGAFLLGGLLSVLGTSVCLMIVGGFVLTIIVLMRQDELALTILLLAHLYVDWYLAMDILSIVLVIVLLGVFYLARSAARPWVEPRLLVLWALFLGLALFPAIRGALTQRDMLIYYPNVVLGAFLWFWMGAFIARNMFALRQLFNMLALFATCIALHTIIQSRFGITLFGLARVDAYIATMGNYQLSGSSEVYRVGSFFIDPNWDGAFLAMMLFPPLGLFLKSRLFLEKILYLVEILLIAIGLLFTYSAGAWLAALVGCAVFFLFVGSTRYRVQLLAFFLVVAVVMFIGFPGQMNLLLQHGSDPTELMLRNGVWQTGLRVMLKYPWTGVGLGHTAYLQYAEPLRVPAQFLPLDHPHNSYLEWGAMAGIPVLVVFVALLALALGYAVQNWRHVDGQTRLLIGAGIAAAVVLSFNSWSINGWTLLPLAAVGWTILGAISSPLLRKKLDS
ncbi:MAG: O-antigen ligase family protein [Chloroflexota bacterium]|nr:O-antigen ligase family protein [Chloroflexota bacterium]